VLSLLGSAVTAAVARQLVLARLRELGQCSSSFCSRLCVATQHLLLCVHCQSKLVPSALITPHKCVILSHGVGVRSILQLWLIALNCRFFPVLLVTLQIIINGTGMLPLTYIPPPRLFTPPPPDHQGHPWSAEAC
jgi:hypothetical protein